MSLYAYVRPVDGNNHAPHVSRGLLSLANCVWMIRERAQVGDWLIGLTSVKKYPDRGRRISYVARVDEKITRRQYWQRYSRFSFARERGRLDNYYEPGTCYPFYHRHKNPFHDSKDGVKDLKSEFVLLSRTFKDFGPNTTVNLSKLSNPWGLCLNSFWNPIHLSLSPPRQRHYRKFPFHVVNLENLVLDWEWR